MLTKVGFFCCDGEIRMELSPPHIIDVVNVLVMTVRADLRWQVRKLLIRG